METPAAISPRQAEDILGELARTRRTTRRALGTPWFPPVVFGAVTMLSAPVVAVAGTGALMPIWIVACAGGMLAVARHYRRRAAARGVTGRGAPIWRVAVAMAAVGFVAGTGAGMLAGAQAGVLAPIVAIVAGYAVLGRMLRTLVLPLGVAASGGAAFALALSGAAPWAVELTFGAGLVAVGAALRLSERSA